MSHHDHHKKPHNAKVASAGASAGTSTKDGAAGAQFVDVVVDTDRIRLRAFEICVARNGGPGNALADWIAAEREVLASRDGGR